MTRTIVQDSTYSYVVALVCFVGLLVESGLRPCLGIYFDLFVDEFEASKANALSMFTIANSLTMLSGPLVAACIVLYGMRLSLIFGVTVASAGYGLMYLAANIYHVLACSALIGFGSGFIRIILTSCLPAYFAKRRTTMLAVVMIGPGIGMFIFPMLLTKTIDAYGWRISMLCNAALMLQCFIPALLINIPRVKPVREEDGTGGWLKDQERRGPLMLLMTLKGRMNVLTDKRLWCNPTFMLHGLCMGLAAASGYIYFGMIIPLMMSHGMSKDAAVLSFTFQGIAALIGRVLGSAWVHFNDHHIPTIFASSLTVGMLSQVVSILCTTSMSHHAVNMVVGVSNGIFFVSMAPFTIYAYGYDLLPTAIGFISFYNGIGGLILPKIGGHLADEFGIESAFFMAAGCGCLAIICGALAAVLVSTEVAEAELEQTKMDLKAATSDVMMTIDESYPFMANGNSVSPPTSRRASLSASTQTPKLTLNEASVDEEDYVPEIATKIPSKPIKMGKSESDGSFESTVDPDEYRRVILAKVERSKRKLSTRLSVPLRISRANSSASAIEEGECSPSIQSPTTRQPRLRAQTRVSHASSTISRRFDSSQHSVSRIPSGNSPEEMEHALLRVRARAESSAIF